MFCNVPYRICSRAVCTDHLSVYEVWSAIHLTTDFTLWSCSLLILLLPPLNAMRARLHTQGTTTWHVSLTAHFSWEALRYITHTHTVKHTQSHWSKMMFAHTNIHINSNTHTHTHVNPHRRSVNSVAHVTSTMTLWYRDTYYEYVIDTIFSRYSYHHY